MAAPATSWTELSVSIAITWTELSVSVVTTWTVIP